MNEQEFLTEIVTAMVEFTTKKRLTHPSQGEVSSSVSKIQM